MQGKIRKCRKVTDKYKEIEEKGSKTTKKKLRKQ